MALVTFLQLDKIRGEAELLEIAKDPRLSDGAEALLTAVADTNLDPDATFDFNYLNVSGGSGNDREPENVSLNFGTITVEYTETDRDAVQKTADSVEAQYESHNDDSANESNLLVLITPYGPGGIGGDDFKVTYALKERDVPDPDDMEQVGSLTHGLGHLTDGYDLLV
jgi:hypothetical protein